MSDNLTLKRLILYPTDLSFNGETAFAHALKIALQKRTGLYILHVGEESNKRVQWEDFPQVRETLTQWGELAPGAERTAVYDQLGIKIDKIEMRGKSIVDGLTDFKRKHRYRVDMMVMATEAREGLPRWLKPSVAEKISRDLSVPTLFIPNTCEPWVSVETGDVHLSRILIPVDHKPEPQLSIAAVKSLVSDLGIGAAEVAVLHVGKENEFPKVYFDDDDSCTFTRLHKSGEIIDEIMGAAENLNAQLIVMTTEGHHGFMDMLRGSVTERILRSAPCPVLAVPATVD